MIYWKKLEDVMCQAQSESLIRTGRLVVDLATRVVSVDDKPVRLTGKEYGILELLCQRKGTTLTKEMFLNHLYGGIDEPEVKIIDVFVCKLRKKLAQATGTLTISRQCGAAAMYFASRRQLQPPRRLQRTRIVPGI